MTVVKRENRATFSEDKRYRYDLTRNWGDGPLALWIMLNPSTADALQDDPTIRRCIAFSKRDGFGGLVVTNICALRSTDPKALWSSNDPVGPRNAYWIGTWMGDRRVSEVICAWGANDPPHRTDVARLAEGRARPLLCLGTTKAGHPRHPLYVKGDQPFVSYVP